MAQSSVVQRHCNMCFQFHSLQTARHVGTWQSQMQLHMAPRTIGSQLVDDIDGAPRGRSPQRQARVC